MFVHLDHSTEQTQVQTALSAGVDGVMVDGSAWPLERNLHWTTQMSALARTRGALVEAEIGRLAGEEDGLSVDEKESKMTDPEEALAFVQGAKVDCLAVTIGNVHGRYASSNPQLDLS